MRISSSVVYATMSTSAASNGHSDIPVMVFMPVVVKVREIVKCRRCVKRQVGRVGDLCGVCRGRGRR